MDLKVEWIAWGFNNNWDNAVWKRKKSANSEVN
jgi:hypothetical protein